MQFYMKLFKSMLYCRACKGTQGNRSQVLLAETNNEYDPTPIIAYNCSCGKQYKHKRFQEFIAQAKTTGETTRVFG